MCIIIRCLATLVSVGLLLESVVDAQLDDAFHGRQNTLINFYGKVLDQDGKPVQGAVIDCDLHSGEWITLPGNKEPAVRMRFDGFKRESDSNGMFVLTNLTGRSIDIKSIKKDGYDLSHDIRNLYAFSGSAQPFRSDPNDPVIFVLWQKSRKPALMSSDKFFRFAPEVPFTITFGKPSTRQINDPEADLQVLIVRPKEASKRNKYDWSFSLLGQNGTLIQPTNRDYFQMPFAPSNGYTNAYGQIYQASGENWRQAGHMQFYVKLQNGKSSGKVALAWDAVAAANGPDTNLCSMRVRYTINPVGSALTE